MSRRTQATILVLAAAATFVAWSVACFGVSGKTQAARGNPQVTPDAVKPTTAPITAPAATPAPRYLIGAWYQPIDSFAKWKARGINTLWGFESQGDTVKLDAWCTSAVANRLYYVLQAADDTTRTHWNDLNCVAIAFSDEANATGPGNVPIPPPSLVARRAAIRLWTGKPILLNFDGWKLQWQDDPTVQAYCDAADWLALDYYVVNRGEGISAWPRVQTQIDRLHRLAPGKPVIVFIECSDQNLKVQDWLHTPENQPQGEQQAALMRGPTVQEQGFELDQSFAAGCPVVYFPDRIGKNWEAYDTIPDDNAAALTAWNAAHTPGTPAPAPLPSPAVPDVLTINGRTYRGD